MIRIIQIASFFLLISCSSGENNLNKQIISGFVFELLPLNVEAYIKSQGADLNDQELRAEYDENLYFILHVSAKTGDKKACDRIASLQKENSHELNYDLLANIPKQMFVVCEGDSSFAKDVNLDRTYGLTPYLNFNIIIDKPSKINDTLQFVWIDQVFSNSPVKFTIIDQL